jgi:hypothetical protein
MSQKSTDLTRQFDEAGLGLGLCDLVQSNLVCHFICEFKTTSQIEAPTLRKNLVLHSSKDGNIIPVCVKQEQAVSSMIVPNFYPFHSLL